MYKENALPAQERTQNPSPDYTAVQAAKQDLFEAIRRGLGVSGVEHDDWDFITQKVIDSLHDAGLLKPDIESVIHSVEPGARTKRYLSVYNAWPDGCSRGVPRSLAQAQEIAAALLSRFGGEVKSVRFSGEPGGVVIAEVEDTEVEVYYDMELGGDA